MTVSFAINDILTMTSFSVNFDLAGSLIDSSEGDALWPLLVSLGELLKFSSSQALMIT